VKIRPRLTSVTSLFYSAGVGRTGAFIAVDAMLERVQKEKTVDIFNYVQLMRNSRTTMVQTSVSKEQHSFLNVNNGILKVN